MPLTAMINAAASAVAMPAGITAFFMSALFALKSDEPAHTAISVVNESILSGWKSSSPIISAQARIAVMLSAISKPLLFSVLVLSAVMVSAVIVFMLKFFILNSSVLYRFRFFVFRTFRPFLIPV